MVIGVSVMYSVGDMIFFVRFGALQIRIGFAVSNKTFGIGCFSFSVEFSSPLLALFGLLLLLLSASVGGEGGFDMGPTNHKTIKLSVHVAKTELNRPTVSTALRVLKLKQGVAFASFSFSERSNDRSQRVIQDASRDQQTIDVLFEDVDDDDGFPGRTETKQCSPCDTKTFVGL